ncbi:quinoprotein glucose dehydrogenase [Povalibacter uvarum]|uniref:Quinoprotein glucose dehydrogenase n=1 Tax=Povalibacter uvarum TaxID=732238 RepID=A0A841HGZ8_9GAMM|nr:pyrroloquinoline quinone-dependent dehydrogenase [Povalibacter uvarum]MBB6092411.1 quinoprotein glucose dehydrogenase [Povalibacter uvarum]
MRRILAAVAAAIFGTSSHGADAQWEFPAGDAGGQRYSSLTQIDKRNVDQLEQVWTYHFKEPESVRGLHSLQMTPLFLPERAGGRLVTCSPFGRIVAIDPETGVEQWRFDSKLDESKIRNHFKCRGITWWEDPGKQAGEACKQRLYMAVIDRRIVAIDAITGRPCNEFGQAGVVKLYEREGWDERIPTVFSTSPPVVAGSNLIVGSQVEDFNHANMPSGTVLALDVRTGELRWSFSAIPEQQQSTDSWPANPRSVSGAANVWAPISVDEARDMVFVPTSSPSPDYYGVARPGDNRYANSVVALQGSTGRVLWHFQFVHHDLWDYDTPSQPILTDVRRDGRTIPALVQTTKQGMVFVFNRETGESLFPIEERPVPRSRIDNELASPTQPFPVKPAPLLQHRLSEKDAWGLTFWDQGKCAETIRSLHNEGIYTPLGKERTLYNPSALGGMNWGGGAVSSAEQLLIVNLSNVAMFGQLVPINQANAQGHANPAFTQVNAMKGTPYAVVMGLILSPLGIPCSAPPWGKLAAIDLESGDIRWQRTLGSAHEMGPVKLPFEIDWGTPNLGGPLLTKSGLVFIGATTDRRLRAFDSATGEKLWTSELPHDGSAAPMTFMHRGRQYVVIAAGGQIAFGRPLGDSLVAFALPAPRHKTK